MQLLKSGRPRVDTTVTVDQGCPKLSSNMREAIQMGFVNEVASDEDIARYNLPFKPGAGRCWTRDKDRDAYLWGDIIGSYVRESSPKGEFFLYVQGVLLEIWLQLEEVELHSFISPGMLSWKAIALMRPYDLGGLSRDHVVEILKEALVVFGVNGSPREDANRQKINILF